MVEMKTIGSIRRANLERLVTISGTLDALAKRADTSSIYLSQIRNSAIDAKTQKGREMGTAMARRLEAACQKPVGWMDVDHEHEPPERRNPFFGFKVQTDDIDPIPDMPDWLNREYERYGREAEAARAHRMSELTRTLDVTTVDWEGLVKLVKDGNVPSAFSLVLKDDAIAIASERWALKGQTARFKTGISAAPGKRVLVADGEDNLYVRIYQEVTPTHWQAVSTASTGYQPLDSKLHSLRVIAVMTGVDWE